MTFGFSLMSSFTTSTLLLLQAKMNPVTPLKSLYSIISGYLSIKSFTIFVSFLEHANIKPVHCYIVLTLPLSFF